MANSRGVSMGREREDGEESMAQGPVAQGPSGRGWWSWTLDHLEAKEKLKGMWVGLGDRPSYL